MADLILNPDSQLVTVEDSSPTISVLWDQAVQKAVVNLAPGPTIASRAYSMMHTAIFDAWAAYDPTAIATQLGDDLQRPAVEVTEANKQEAISYAAYQVLADLFPSQVDIFDSLMAELGYDPENRTTDTTTAAGIGNVSAQALLHFRHYDGSNQLGENPNGDGSPYSNYTSYQPVNSVDEIRNLELWTPEYVPIDDPNGSVQKFLTPQWGEVIPFALDSGAQFRPVAPEPFLLVEGHVDLGAQTIALADGSVLDIDRSLIGSVINPEFINQATEVIKLSAKLTDEQKLIAEFWEDGGGTAFPPGTWMTFGQFVSARDDHSLDDDVKLFFSLGNAVFDAGIATWEAKVFYDYVRPVRAIRELGKLGLIGEFNSDLGGFAIEAWQPEVGTQTILAQDFLTYQTPGSDPSPPFAEYTSGHSSFSAAGAEILRLFTESDDFGASVTFAPGESRFEPGITPAAEITLAWDSFSAAAEEAGLSRLYGGIHFEDGDLNGRSLGREVGKAVFKQAQFYINGGVATKVLLDTPIYRLQSNHISGTYLYTGEEESSHIPTDFSHEGLAFKAAVEADDELIALYRFQSNQNPGAYLWVGESERAKIQSDENLSQAFSEEGLAFYVYGVGAGQATEFYRFRSLNIAGSYLYVTGAERANLIANYSDSYVEEGVAFEARVL
ncbi:MAG: vanadium-dependent haloperoxidase [Xenococcus sp. MO_188.B8]|nr:vanadium-dependent haloperoxidase [Xenococcus sp. MO_188.B8]